MNKSNGNLITKMEELVRELANIEITDECNASYIQDKAENLVMLMNAQISSVPPPPPTPPKVRQIIEGRKIVDPKDVPDFIPGLLVQPYDVQRVLDNSRTRKWYWPW